MRVPAGRESSNANPGGAGRARRALLRLDMAVCEAAPLFRSPGKSSFNPSGAV